MVKKAKYMIFLAHLLVSTAERERGGLLGGPDVFRRLPRGSPLKVPSSLYWHLRKLKKKPSLWFFKWRWVVIFNLYLMASIRLSIGVAVTRSAPSFRSPAWTVNSRHKGSNRSQHNRWRTLLQKYHEYFCNRNDSNHHPLAFLDRVVEYQLWSN